MSHRIPNQTCKNGLSNTNGLTRQSFDSCYTKQNINIDEYLGKNFVHELPEVCNKMNFVATRSKGTSDISTSNELTHDRNHQELFLRPYLGHFEGAGKMSLNPFDVELETELFQGVSSNLREKACLESRDSTFTRFECLPEYGNPQKIDNCIQKFPRIGEPTRDYVRRVDYYRRCKLDLKY